MMMSAQSAILAGLRAKRTNSFTISENKSNNAKNGTGGNSVTRNPKLAQQMKKGKKTACYESRFLKQIMSASPVTRQMMISERIVDMSMENLSIMVHVDGDRYIGSAKDGEPHGHGTAVSPGGDIYSGEWYRGQPQGEGIYFWADEVAYMGMWHEGKRHGRGVLMVDNVAYPCRFEHGNMTEFDGQVCEKVFFMEPRRISM